MDKYIFNCNIHGYIQITIGNDKLKDIKDSLIIFVVDKSLNEQLSECYVTIGEMLRHNNRVILLGIEDDNIVFKPLAALMATFNDYDIYNVIDKTSVLAPYLQEIESRSPGFEEVETYIGGDTIAYSELVTIMFGIQSMVEEGNTDKLDTFINQHINSISELSTTLDMMKKTCDMYDSHELDDRIRSLESHIKELSDSIDDKDRQISDAFRDRDSLKEISVEKDKKIAELTTKNAELSTIAASGTSVIKSFNELSTSSIKCLTKQVIYFKEISYVPYVNTLIDRLLKFLAIKKLKTKLLIYDSGNQMFQAYGNLQTIDGENYMSKKDNLINKVPAFVVAEPNQIVIKDILTSDKAFDVVIVYDKMHTVNDVVTGNNVCKYYVMKSSTDYANLQKLLKINPDSNIITLANNAISGVKYGNINYLDIPFIADFNNSTDSAKTSKYLQLTSRHSGQKIILSILEKSHIQVK